MSALLFLPLAAVEGWTARGAVEVSANVLTVQSGSARGARLELVPAVRFLAVAGEGADAGGLTGKVKPVAELREAGAELLGDSVLFGEVAYEVQQGFTAQEARQTSLRQRARDDAAELARFLLNRLP